MDFEVTAGALFTSVHTHLTCCLQYHKVFSMTWRFRCDLLQFVDMTTAEYKLRKLRLFRLLKNHENIFTFAK